MFWVCQVASNEIDDEEFSLDDLLEVSSKPCPYAIRNPWKDFSSEMRGKIFYVVDTFYVFSLIRTKLVYYNCNIFLVKALALAQKKDPNVSFKDEPELSSISFKPMKEYKFYDIVKEEDDEDIIVISDFETSKCEELDKRKYEPFRVREFFTNNRTTARQVGLF